MSRFPLTSCIIVLAFSLHRLFDGDFGGNTSIRDVTLINLERLRGSVFNASGYKQLRYINGRQHEDPSASPTSN